MSDERPDVQQAREKVIEAICLYRSGGEGTGAGVSNALNALVTAVRADSEAEIRRLREALPKQLQLAARLRLDRGGPEWVKGFQAAIEVVQSVLAADTGRPER